jgi:predicted transcriptional regulator
MMTEENEQLIELTSSIVISYVSHNSVPPSDLAALIESTYATLVKLGAMPDEEPEVPLVPAVPIRKSVTPDAIICLEDGKRFKSLKRHLGKLGMTPAEYRAKWGLPSDYPMVAPNYSEARAALAREIGLGRKVTNPAVKTKRTARG